MDFSTSRMRRASEPALPMINVVFLLLIFFLMSAQISTPPPVEVSPPAASGAEAAVAESVLYVTREGVLAMGEARAEAVWAMLAAMDEENRQMPMTLNVDGALPAADLARVLGRLSALGFENLHLATRPD
ncbi:ExbD/TolR family protein [Roseovarius sp. E0-M6]|uniref:ExbD/TolR family protein n=1 Tax=Roseovarius sp. E0-M6 TaxID=3127118 RepID=UPI00300F92EC